jgi:hypothetical protein
VSLNDVNARDVLIQVSRSIHDPTLPERRRRIALIRWLKLIGDQTDQYIHELWRLGFGKDNIADEEQAVRRAQLHRIEEEKSEIVWFYTRLVREVPEMFLQTAPSQWAQSAFLELFPSFKREAEACFEGMRTLESGFYEGVYLPVESGGNVRVPFSLLFSSLEILEHLRILKLAAGSITDLFPADEVEEARNPVS